MEVLVDLTGFRQLVVSVFTVTQEMYPDSLLLTECSRPHLSIVNFIRMSSDKVQTVCNIPVS